MAIQEQLDKLRRADPDLHWRHKPNEWLRQLSGPSLSDVAVELVASVTGGSRNRTRSVPYKVLSGEARIDVKVATLSEIGGAPAFGWRNLRDFDRLTHIAFLAIYPSTSRLFIVPVVDIPAIELKHTNVYGEYQVVVSSADALPTWLVEHESSGAA